MLVADRDGLGVQRRDAVGVLLELDHAVSREPGLVRDVLGHAARPVAGDADVQQHLVVAVPDPVERGRFVVQHGQRLPAGPDRTPGRDSPRGAAKAETEMLRAEVKEESARF